MANFAMGSNDNAVTKTEDKSEAGSMPKPGLGTAFSRKIFETIEETTPLCLKTLSAFMSPRPVGKKTLCNGVTIFLTNY
jgi:hypothetical protein